MSDEVKKDEILVSCCGDCPFRIAGPKCSESTTVEIDEETMEDDLPVLCPMLNAHPRTHEGKTIKLEDWLLRSRRDDSNED